MPQPLSRDQFCPAEASSEDSEKKDASSSAFVMRRLRRLGNKRCPYHHNQEKINNFIREMALTNSNAELLKSRLKQWDLLDNSVLITSQRKRHRVFSTFFPFRGSLFYYHDKRELFEAIKIPPILPIGDSLLTAHQEVSKLSYRTTQTSAPSSLWLIQ